jgi:hypothetical protein
MKRYAVPVLLYVDAEDKEESIFAVNNFLLWQLIGTNFEFEQVTDSEFILDYSDDDNDE